MITKGQKINDRYEIIKNIGEGGMATVYLGYDTILDRNVAIKILRGDLSGDEKFVRRFQREALSASSLSHTNIVEMYDVGEDNGIYYIVMEYVQGKTLKQLLKKRGALTLSEVIDIMLQLTDGMASAHDSYIIHRDLKPQNIMIQDDGKIKIMDFGIAMALNSTQLTQTNSVMGSVHYLPPEQAGGKGSTIKSDIYSMGIIFFELLSGSLPFRGDNAVEIALKHMKEPIPDLLKINPSIPQSIENIVLRSTAKNPKNRYENAREMHNDLLHALDDERMDDTKYVYPYPEHESDTKAIKKLEEVDQENTKEAEDIIATQIEDGATKKQRKLIIILSAIFGGILALLLTIFFIVPAITNSRTVTIPNVRNMSVAKASSRLKEYGLKVSSRVKEEYSDTIEKGNVISTNPKIGKKIRKGSIIKLTKSKGPEAIKLEDYKGQNYIAVQTKLEGLGLKVVIEKREPDTGTEPGEQEIIGQSLAAGSEVKKGEQVTLYIPNIVDEFPNMRQEGWSLDDAEAFCKKYGLTINTKYQETTEVEEGKVVSQSRAPGAPIVKGTTLTVTIAKKPTPTPTPTPSDEKEEDEKQGN